jgi:hypothetical protein
MTKRVNRRRLISSGLSLMVLVALAAPAVAEEPTPADLLDAYVEALGGKAALEKIDNRVTRGKLEIPAQGIVMAITAYSARPNLIYLVMESDMTGKIERGTDGEVYWEMSAMMGPQVKDGQERTDFLRDSTFDKWLHWRELYPEVEYAGSETIDGKQVNKVVVKPTSGEPQTLFLDAESNLAVRLDMIAETPMGEFPVVSRMSDYREIDGILIPFRVDVEVMNQQRVITTESVEHNVDLPADRFALPTEIRAIVEADAGEADAEEKQTAE